MVMQVQRQASQATLLDQNFANTPAVQARTNIATRSDVLVSMSQAGGESAATEEKTSFGTKFCRCAYSVVTAPFRFVAWIAVTVYNCICCKSDKAAESTSAQKAKEAEQPERSATSASAAARIGLNAFEKVVKGGKEFDLEQAINAYASLPRDQQAFMKQIVWSMKGGEGAVGPLKDFNDVEAVQSADAPFLVGVVATATAYRKIGVFASAIQNLKIADLKADEQEKAIEKAKKTHYDPMLRGDDMSGQIVKHKLGDAVAILRGQVRNAFPSHADAAKVAVLGKFDAPVREAAQRLSKGSLLASEDVEALDKFMRKLDTKGDDVDSISALLQREFATLEKASPEAAKLLLFVIANRYDTTLPSTYISHTARTSEAREILEIAESIVLFEKGITREDVSYVSSREAAPRRGGDDLASNRGVDPRGVDPRDPRGVDPRSLSATRRVDLNTSAGPNEL